MRIKNKLFPYPTLHREKILSEYDGVIFELKCEEERDEQFYVLKNVYIDIDDVNLLQLLDKGDIKCVCIVECPRCMYRKVFEVSPVKQDIKIPLFDLAGKIEISCFIYAAKSLSGFVSNKFLDDYSGYSFDIEKNCILAIDNGFNQRIDYEDINDNKKASIFVLINDLDENNKTCKWTYDENVIKISVPKAQHSEYETIKHLDAFKNTFLSVLVVPVLTLIISDLVKKNYEIGNLEYNYKWFKAFNDTYERVFEKRINDELFLSLENEQIYSIVQEIFNYCIINAIDDIFVFCNTGIGEVYE